MFTTQQQLEKAQQDLGALTVQTDRLQEEAVREREEFERNQAERQRLLNRIGAQRLRLQGAIEALQTRLAFEKVPEAEMSINGHSNMIKAIEYPAVISAYSESEE